MAFGKNMPLPRRVNRRLKTYIPLIRKGVRIDKFGIFLTPRPISDTILGIRGVGNLIAPVDGFWCIGLFALVCIPITLFLCSA